jgi:tRNA-dihydrouridine synthase B
MTAPDTTMTTTPPIQDSPASSRAAAEPMFSEPLRIGPLELSRRVFPAPMCGISDRATRTVAREMGCELTYTQMFSCEGITRDDEKTWEMIDIDGEERPVAVQLFGSDPVRLGDAARAMQDKGASLVDLNMGCPARKITGNSCGSALMREPELVAKIAREMRRGCSEIAFTVKMRAGWDGGTVNMTEIARIAEAEGADAVCLHPRTKEQRFTGKSDWELIGELKAAVKIPVIGNGDIQCGSDAVRMIRQTGCDAVMLGRGALGSPWALRDCLEKLHPDQMAAGPAPYAQAAEPVADPREDGREDSGARIPLEERLKILRRHAELMTHWKGEHRGMIELRKHGIQYFRGLRNAKRFKESFVKMRTLEELELLFAQVLEHNPLTLEEA